MNIPTTDSEARARIATDSYVVIGNPIEHSLSPWIHARFAQLAGHKLTYERVLAPLDGFAGVLRRLQREGIKGCNITVPFKLDAAQLATVKSERVQLAQAANTLSLLPDGNIHADNTDGPGLVQDITVNAGVALEGRHVLLLGAGGAAAGVLASLIVQKPLSLTVVNRTVERAQVLINNHRSMGDEHDVMLYAFGMDALIAAGAQGSGSALLQALRGERMDVLINATASSLQGSHLELPPAKALLKPSALIYDMMYGPSAAHFLQWGAQLGPQANVRDGLGMLVEQAAQSFKIWRGILPPGAEVLCQLREKLAAASAT